MKSLQSIAWGFLLILSGINATQAKDPERGGNGAGNGGDLIRQSFLLEGEAIIRSLSDTSAGQMIVQKFGLNLKKLSQTLTIGKITVVSKSLIDNRGSVVDALGSPAGIFLNQKSWSENVMRSPKLRQLVFHEMLRAAGVNDDDYRISKALPKPEKPQWSKLASEFISLREEFEAAGNLTKADLLLFSNGGITYRCEGTSGVPGTSGVVGTLIVSAWRKSILKIVKVGKPSRFSAYSTYQQSDFGWVARSDTDENVQYPRSLNFVRKNSAGELLFEIAFRKIYPPRYTNIFLPDREEEESKLRSAPSAVIPIFDAFHYVVCTPKK